MSWVQDVFVGAFASGVNAPTYVLLNGELKALLLTSFDNKHLNIDGRKDELVSQRWLYILSGSTDIRMCLCPLHRSCDCLWIWHSPPASFLQLQFAARPYPAHLRDATSSDGALGVDKLAHRHCRACRRQAAARTAYGRPAREGRE